MLQAQTLLRLARPHLARGDAAALAEALRERCTTTELTRLLQCPQAEVRQVAALGLGLVAGPEAVPCLARTLHDPEPGVNQMAEHGLWSIWFRASSPAAAEPFHEGVTLLAREQYEPAIECFEQASEIDPDFAEAYNQCGIAWFLLGEWRASLSACRAAARRVPAHFGAISGMGHCYTHLEDLERALACYRQALAINPRMGAIARAVARLEAKLGATPGSDAILGPWISGTGMTSVFDPTRG